MKSVGSSIRQFRPLRAPRNKSFRKVLRGIVKATRAGENGRTMPNKDVVIVILAAGKGTRLRSSLAKVLHRAGGRRLIEHVVRCCGPLKPKRMVTVVGHRGDQATAAVDPLAPQICLQRPQT